MASPTHSLVIPAYNEAARLNAAFERLRPSLEILGPENTEIVMVDDGSSDDTMRVAHQVYGHLEHFRLIQHPHNMGKGAAVRTGMAHARYPKVIVADADMSIRPEHFVSILSALDHVSFAPGTRARNGKIHYQAPQRTVSGNVFHLLVRHYTKIAVRDTQCGCKGFRLAAGRLMAELGFVTGFAYDVEIFYLAEQLGFDTESVNVTWDDIGGSTVNLSRGKRELLSDLRGIARTKYECPAIEVETQFPLDDVRRAAIEARAAGLVVARGEAHDVIVVPRNAAVAAIGIAQSLGGTLRTTSLSELRGRTLVAV
ncbi:MAG: glycosyltransferase [Acidimicrobiaceae bacterium]|nr:glycosyltransferase [Acidimicrobiaceae bacterium]